MDLILRVGTIRLTKAGFEVIQLTYDTFDLYQNIKDMIIENVETEAPDIIMGLSLGGYFAIDISKELDIPFIALNPSINPKVSMFPYIDVDMFNYVTEETKVLKENTVNSYITIKGHANGIVFLDSGDEVIDANETYEYLKYSSNIHMFVGGSHRFEHLKESIKIIKDELTPRILNHYKQ